MPSAPLQISVARNEDVTIVTMRGDADLAAADVLSNALLPIAASRPAYVMVDLAGLTFISSLGIGQLVSLRRGLAAHGGKVTIAAPQPRVMQALKHAQVESLFEIVAESPHDAVA